MVLGIKAISVITATPDLAQVDFAGLNFSVWVGGGPEFKGHHIKEWVRSWKTVSTSKVT